MPNSSEDQPLLSQETGTTAPITERKTRGLIRELRQPLSSIEAIVDYLEMTFPFDQTGPRQHLRQLKHRVEETKSILRNADADVCADMAAKV
jgi:hypothetical protein